ncbi:sarcocystatin-A [Drosophila ficusphila]|uniref:sarcocystatin-A n=1 Tax=Drosophila ficusphila TaxID=30025 RepID=UPI0007E7578D|nr:sarcocystatin-A [Drosophila ficusphila]
MFAAKILILCAVSCVLVNATPQGLGGIVGGVRNLDGKDLAEAQETLQTSLTKLAAGADGPHYRISKVLSATHQVVSGSAYVFSVELIDNQEAKKVCDVNIWSQPWLPNGIKVTFKCPNEPELVRQHSA